MKTIKLSHSQRELYTLCPRKYFYRYIKKMRPRNKGSALFFGISFDESTEVLVKGGTVEEAKEKFNDLWGKTETNFNVKFAKSDFDSKVLKEVDLKRLESITINLNRSKPLENYENHKDILKLISDLIKFRDNSYIRDLTETEEQFLHLANYYCMLRKGHLMIESFSEHILPKITKVHGTQISINIQHPDGHKVGGYIDLACEMEGYELPSGRKLKANELVVADVKSAGTFSWKKHDNIENAPQLDTYLISPEIQALARSLTGQETNLVAYFVTSKNIQTHEESFCKKCGNKKKSRHKTCNAEIDGSRCNGEWEVKKTLYCDSKIVIAERNLEEARMMLYDFDDILSGIQAEVFPRDRNSCEAFGAVCDYKSICGKCFKNPEKAIEDWKDKYGE